MEKPVVYIACPISGQPNLNSDAFYKMQEVLNAQGFDTRNPLEFCRDIESENESDPAFYKRGLIVLTECTDIILLNGWKYSKGAQLERQAASLFGIGIFESEQDLIHKYAGIYDHG
jgi:hypothetical protein